MAHPANTIVELANNKIAFHNALFGAADRIVSRRRNRSRAGKEFGIVQNVADSMTAPPGQRDVPAVFSNSAYTFGLELSHNATAGIRIVGNDTYIYRPDEMARRFRLEAAFGGINRDTPDRDETVSEILDQLEMIDGDALNTPGRHEDLYRLWCSNLSRYGLIGY